MGFRDVLKKSFLEGFTSADITTTDIFVTLLVTLALSIYIYAVYRIITRRSFYSKSFNISLVALALLTASIIITIQSSIVISLGMVGALSIVRFRTAIKDPMDLVFLFWSIAIGLTCGANLYEVAAITSIIVTAAIVILEYLPSAKAALLLVVNLDNQDAELQVEEAVKQNTKSYKIKSRNQCANGLDIIIELRTKDERLLFQEVSQIEGVKNISLLSHDGEVTY